LKSTTRARRSPEDVCIEYAIAAAHVRELTRKIVPGECTNMASTESLPTWGEPPAPHEPCISRLFSLKPEYGRDRESYLEASEEIQDEMCDRCRESLKAVRERKIARVRLGAAKRSVEAIGKRLNAEAAS
jgi:hypothetical protein